MSDNTILFEYFQPGNTSGDILIYNAGINEWEVTPLTFDEIVDININNISDGDLLQWDNALQIWKNVSFAALPGDNLGNHIATTFLDMSDNKIIDVADGINAKDVINRHQLDSHNHFLTSLIDIDHTSTPSVNQFLSWNGIEWEYTSYSALPGDNLGNHIADQNINMSNDGGTTKYKIINLAPGGPNYGGDDYDAVNWGQVKNYIDISQGYVGVSYLNLYFGIGIITANNMTVYFDPTGVDFTSGGRGTLAHPFSDINDLIKMIELYGAFMLDVDLLLNGQSNDYNEDSITGITISGIKSLKEETIRIEGFAFHNTYNVAKRDTFLQFKNLNCNVSIDGNSFLNDNSQASNSAIHFHDCVGYLRVINCSVVRNVSINGVFDDFIYANNSSNIFLENNGTTWNGNDIACTNFINSDMRSEIFSNNNSGITCAVAFRANNGSHIYYIGGEPVASTLRSDNNSAFIVDCKGLAIQNLNDVDRTGLIDKSILRYNITTQMWEMYLIPYIAPINDLGIDPIETWSSSKIVNELAQKQDLLTTFIPGNFASINVSGQVEDSGFTNSNFSLVGHTHTINIDDLADVQAPSPNNNQILQWNGTLSQWVAVDFPCGLFMQTSTYDVNLNGIVDCAEALCTGTQTVTATQVLNHINDVTIHALLNDISTLNTEVWSAAKTISELNTKVDKVIGGTAGHIVELNGVGNISDTGIATVDISLNTHTHSLNALTDVTIGTPILGQVLMYGASGQWLASSISTGDMFKAVYDTGNTGRVDAAESLNDGTNVVLASSVLNHVGDLDIHRAMNDAITSSTTLWSSQKITNEITNAQLIANSVSIQGVSVDTSVPTVGQSLVYDGVKYTPTTVIGGGPIAMDDLTDVSALTPNDGDSVIWSSTNSQWELSSAGTAPTLTGPNGSISNITNVSSTTPINGQTLVWNNTTNEWTPQAIPGVNPALNDITDVNASAPNIGDVVQWDGTNWVNKPSSPWQGQTSKYKVLALNNARYFDSDEDYTISAGIARAYEYDFGSGTDIIMSEIKSLTTSQNRTIPDSTLISYGSSSFYSYTNYFGKGAIWLFGGFAFENSPTVVLNARISNIVDGTNPQQLTPTYTYAPGVITIITVNEEVRNLLMSITY